MEKHTMDLVSRDGDVSTYYCPQCGRRLKINYKTMKRTVLEEGNADPMTTSHSGSEGGLIIGITTVPKEIQYRWN